MNKSELLNWNENKNNWYSYNAKTNTEDFGIDCSGFVVNAITGIGSGNCHSFTTSTLDIAAQSIETEYCRKLPISENYDANSYLTKNDIVYSRNHIAFCSDGYVDKDFDNEYVLKKYFTDDRKFNICHNYGADFIFPTNYNLFAKKKHPRLF